MFVRRSQSSAPLQTDRTWYYVSKNIEDFLREHDAVTLHSDQTNVNELFNLLSVHLGPKQMRISVAATNLPSPYGADLPPSKWSETSSTVQPKKRSPLPRGTCKLSGVYRWPFDVDESEEAVPWALRRLIESSTLQGFKRRRGLAHFPDDFQENRYNVLFGPFNRSGLVLSLRQCKALPCDVAVLAIDTREKWLHYIERGHGRFLITHFPPLSHVVGTMVDEAAFTDEVAMDVYGIFDDCTVGLAVQGSALPALIATKPSSDELDSISIAELPMEARGINGVTVLFLACLVLRAGAAASKLLNMQKAGAVILADMADKGLGWVMQPADLSAVVQGWIGDALHARLAKFPLPRVALLLEAWAVRPSGLYISVSNRSIPDYERLAGDIRRLAPTNCLDANSSLRDVGAHLAFAAVFAGCSAGTALAVISRATTQGSFPSAVSTSPENAGNIWPEEHLLDSSFITENSCLRFQARLQRLLGGLKKPNRQDVLDQIDKSFTQLARGVTGDLRRELRLLFYRSCLVSMTGGHLVDDGRRPLTWHSKSLRQSARVTTAVHRAQPEPVPIEWPPLPVGNGRSWSFTVVAVCVIGMLVLVTVSTRLPTSPTAHSSSSQRQGVSLLRQKPMYLGMGRLEGTYLAGDEMIVSAGDHVYVLEELWEDWYKIKSLEGHTGVRQLAYVLFNANHSWFLNPSCTLCCVVRRIHYTGLHEPGSRIAGLRSV
ncbi:hypothetical protein A1Q1_03096 [Trichosporon asahii var. asahii CBS 2479]|uniref:SH3 domain-containing protein n=1 Tax=Trichosporon asahii var. asahii (strain ATCC 90039 / CBS 2479 / JCM 2466 / KCTC 7840 / NBRC 103889/ NCYC 2677 / UAMH 7654) TaxID=1186058 RepID=J6FC07_TRIAS|nr:hypothetical protein A1Q1_03096 [Trichosporon asahii var. asahii CBS 2479]EJT52642.1 hypothetical protein A1Q1_03096 [Trichosporon asahii var. asahii CBS 2479]